jgi:hypothetical protein
VVVEVREDRHGLAKCFAGFLWTAHGGMHDAERVGGERDSGNPVLGAGRVG